MNRSPQEREIDNYGPTWWGGGGWNQSRRITLRREKRGMRQKLIGERGKIKDHNSVETKIYAYTEVSYCSRWEQIDR